MREYLFHSIVRGVDFTVEQRSRENGRRLVSRDQSRGLASVREEEVALAAAARAAEEEEPGVAGSASAGYPFSSSS